MYRYVAIETSISGEVARKFAVATGSSVTLHEHSVPYLQADYDPFHTIECKMRAFFFSLSCIVL